MVRTCGELLNKTLYESKLEDFRDRDGPCTKWLDGVKRACTARSMKLSDSNMEFMDGKHWKDFVNGISYGRTYFGRE